MNDAKRADHDATAALVAYAAGAASDAERAEIEADAARDQGAAARLAVAVASRDALAEQDAEERDEWSPGEMGFRRLMREIEREEKATTVAWTESVAVWRGVAAAAAVALVAVSVWRFDGAQTAGVDGYAPAAVTAEDQVLAQVAFAPSATEAEIRALLVETGGAFVDGPSAIGLYRIGYASAEERDRAVARLRAASFVESAAAE